VAPELDPGLRWVWRAWERLSPSRPYSTVGVSAGLGGSVVTPRPLPIPWRFIREWADAYRLDDAAADALDRYIRVLDNVFLAWWRKDHAAAVQALADQQKQG